MTKQSASLKTSGTIGAACRAIVAQSSIGSGRGAIVCGRWPLEPSATLANRRPDEVERSLQAYCERISGRRIVFERRMMFPESGPSYSVVTGVSWTLPPESVDECRKAIIASLRSAPESQLVQALYRLRILTRGREQRQEDNAEAEAVIWVEKLRCWPGDIALAVIDEWTSRTGGQWWPTWHEVEKEISARTSLRQALLNHIDSPPPPKAIRAHRATDEERAEVLAKYASAKPEIAPVHKPTAEEIEAELAQFRERLAGLTISPAALARVGIETKEANA